MSWHAYRRHDHWGYGWTSDRGWLHLARLKGTTYLDLWHWRVRWASLDHRPLFSEHYGHTKWHTLGRLGFHYAKPKRDEYRRTDRPSAKEQP